MQPYLSSVKNAASRASESPGSVGMAGVQPVGDAEAGEVLGNAAT